VQLLKDGVTEDNLFEPLDGGSTMGGPDKQALLFGEFSEWFGNISETMNKGALIPEDAEHTMDLLYGGELFRPSGEAILFHRVNANGPVADNNTQVIDSGAFKFALRWFQEETLSLEEVEDVMNNMSVEREVIGGHDEDVIHVDKEHSWILVL
jgi:hypothetical protein